MYTPSGKLINLSVEFSARSSDSSANHQKIQQIFYKVYKFGYTPERNWLRQKQEMKTFSVT